MDRALKERIIGAVVLVAFAVLVVPVFLDGPANDAEMIRETVTLPGQGDQPRKQQTIVLERDRTEPVPVASAPATTPSPAPPPAQKSAQNETLAASTEVEPKPVATSREEAEVPPASTTGMWAVQLGSFSSRDNAERLASDLREDGYAAFLSQLDTSNGQLHRVRIGPQEDRDAAESVAASLTRSGHSGQVVPHP